ncbi:hypothetical protein J6590_075753 [Homalodisca vitripennis]|nr:hypothetical protein J6590_075753 [Homalodisca vitripennis]
MVPEEIVATEIPSLVMGFRPEAASTHNLTEPKYPVTPDGKTATNTNFFDNYCKLLARRKVKRDFSTRHLQGYNTDQQIYINPSLTPVRRVLLAKARRLRFDFNYKFVWVDRV